MTRDLSAVYDKIHGRYELANHVITGCMDIHWRRKMMGYVKYAKPGIWLDLCCGTGETTALLSLSAEDNTRVMGTDFTASMLREARRRVSDPDFLLSDANTLPFADGTFTLVTMAFATRNLATSSEGLENALGEVLRVLIPGGFFLNLDTSQPPNGVLRSLAHLYTVRAVRPLHGAMTGSKGGARYLARTVKGFHDAETLTGILSRVGFIDIAFQRLFFGAAAVHVAQKPP